MRENKQSLVLITVDCLRADHCGFHGYSRATTPCLSSLATESIVMAKAIVAGAPTYYSLPAIFASRMPLALGRDVIGLAAGEETLATALRKAGYATAGFSAANPYISARFGFNQGFDEFRDFLDFDGRAGGKAESGDESQPQDGRHLETLNGWLKQSADRVGLGKLYDELYFQYLVRVRASPVSDMDALRKYPSAEVVVEAAKSWLETVEPGRPFFLWLHLMDPHAPYYPPPRALQQLTGKEISPARARYINEFWNRSDLSATGLRRKKKEIIDLYDASIRWVDTQVDRLIEYLKGAQRWENSVLALTADHGEEFLEHGRRYHVPVSMAEEIVHVPLLIRMPVQWADASGQRIEPSNTPFSLLHLAPTLLDILEVASPSSFRGESLRRGLREQSGSEGEADPALTELAYDCTNPFRGEMRLSSRLVSVRDAKYKLVYRLESDAIEQLYDLQADPAEQRPLPSGAVPEIRQHFLKVAAAHISKTIADKPAVPRLQSRLRELKLELKSSNHTKSAPDESRDP
ncbi:MAG TPA: sulfatase [Terriglobales bacterium]|nr:sulfatase [Terriglobales bacterium]